MAKSQNNATNTLTLVGDLFAIAGSILKTRTDRGVEKIHTLSEATRDYASNLTDMPHLRAQAVAASESMEEVADYAIHTDVQHMFADTVAIVRKYPVATIGFTMAAGMIVALLARSTPAPIIPQKSKLEAAKKKVVAAVRARSNGKAKDSSVQKNV